MSETHDQSSGLDEAMGATPAGAGEDTVASAPPTSPSEAATPRPSSWPTVVGTILIVIAALGGLSYVVGIAGLFIQGFIPGTEAQLQAAEAWIGWALASNVLSLLLSLWLLATGILLIRRAPSTRMHAIGWSVTKMIVVVIASTIAAFMQADQMAAMQTQGQAMPQAMIETMRIASLVIGIVFGWALPIFLLIWFNVGRFRRESTGWAAGANPARSAR